MYDSKHRSSDGQIYDSRKDTSGYTSTKREWNMQVHEYDDETSNHRKYMRTQSSSNNRFVPNSSAASSQQQQRQNGDKKTVKDTRKPLRVSGDWSEFKSSKGKTYFYNCKTEVSQWEKPKGWSSDDSSSNRTSSTSIPATDRLKKESATVRSRHKVDPSVHLDKHSSHSQSKAPSKTSYHHLNGTAHEQPVAVPESIPTPATTRLPSPADDGSPMSFSSTSSKESSSAKASTNGLALHSSFSEPAVSVTSPPADPAIRHVDKPLAHAKETRHSINRPSFEFTSSIDAEPLTPSLSKAERDHEIQKYYRAELIQHLTDWRSTQLEKQCLKLFDEYYGYSAKISSSFVALKASKSNSRVLQIKRNILTQRLLRCQNHVNERDDDRNNPL